MSNAYNIWYSWLTQLWNNMMINPIMAIPMLTLLLTYLIKYLNKLFNLIKRTFI